jgi:hypothetical protein
VIGIAENPQPRLRIEQLPGILHIRVAARPIARNTRPSPSRRPCRYLLAKRQIIMAPHNPAPGPGVGQIKRSKWAKLEYRTQHQRGMSGIAGLSAP